VPAAAGPSSSPEPHSPHDGVDADAVGLIEFIDSSPSPFHAVARAAAALDAAGFTRLDERQAWPAPPGRCYLVRGGTLVAWAVEGEASPAAGFRLVGAHTDSPNLRIKPRPDAGGAGFRQLGIEVYGGALLNSWLDRDLGLSGRVTLRRDGRPETVLMRVDRALLRVPQLAIHLDRGVNEHGLVLNPQHHLAPVWGLGRPSEDGFRRFLADELGEAPDDILAWDVMAHDLTPGAVLGVDRSMISAPRIDNLASCYAAVRALVEHVAVEGAGSPDPESVPVICLFDHEEIGSQSAEGADSSLLPVVLERIVAAGGGTRDAFLRALATSRCVSADGAHATHPNYPERHEPGHPISLDAGPVLKHNASVRYATDAVSAGWFVLACEKAGVPLQHFVSRSDLPCGSTIGPVTASRLGIPTLDVGMPQLSMHSARELCGTTDPGLFVRALTAFLAG